MAGHTALAANTVPRATGRPGDPGDSFERRARVRGGGSPRNRAAVAALAALCAALALLTRLTACTARMLGPDQGPRKPGDPPRVAASNLNEYRHLQFYNDEYKNWIRDTIRPVEYVNQTGVIELGWQDLQQRAAAGGPVVVMVTQSTVSRLQSLKLVMKEWNGPVALTIFIDYLGDSPEAHDCAGRITEYLHNTFATLWPAPGATPAISVSFLYTAFAMDDAGCDVPVSSAPSGAATAAARKVAARRTAVAIGDDTYRDSESNGVLWSPHTLLRRLAGAVGDASRITDPGGGPAVTDAWHYWPNKRVHRLRAPDEPWQLVYDAYYPVNTLRNLAWGQVPSGAFVFLNDVDFLPTPTLHADLVHGAWRSELQRMRAAFFDDGARETLVLPAFERLADKGPGGEPKATPWRGPCREEDGCATIDGVALPRSFEMLRTMVQKETVVDIFHRKQFFPGHGCYSWMTWLQSETPSHMVNMEYSNPCEPYVIALSDAMPRYDERFRGRGQNKVEQLTHMAMWGFSWRVLPGHFVLHVPHPSVAPDVIGWDEVTTPLVLTKLKIEEIEQQPEFKRHVTQAVPLPIV